MAHYDIRSLTASFATIFLLGCSGGMGSDADMVFKDRAAFSPPSYVCYKAPASITIDGKITPEEWNDIPWTEYFGDIRGEKGKKPYLKSMAKMAYDDNGMYIAVLMEEPHVWATITEHDTEIYMDNSVEFFIDPTNDTHDYVEYEINALGTDWDLYLSSPYRDDPVVISDWECSGMRSAIHIDGTLNNPNDKDKSWSMELFMPWKSIYQLARGKDRPVDGDQVRVNLMRVEWPITIENGKYRKAPHDGEDEINESFWTWAPMGEANIHIPEYWGYVQFTDMVAGKGKVEFINRPEEATKWVLRNLYYRQGEIHDAKGRFSSSATELKASELADESQLKSLEIHVTPSLYEMSLLAPDGNRWAIRQDGKVYMK